MKSPLITPPTTPQLDVEDTESRDHPPLRETPDRPSRRDDTIPDDSRPADGSDREGQKDGK